METTSEISEEIRKLIEHKDEIPFLIIGSSDLTHYEPNDKASKKDHELLAEVEKLQYLLILHRPRTEERFRMWLRLHIYGNAESRAN